MNKEEIQQWHTKENDDGKSCGNHCHQQFAVSFFDSAHEHHYSQWKHEQDRTVLAVCGKNCKCEETNHAVSLILEIRSFQEFDKIEKSP